MDVCPMYGRRGTRTSCQEAKDSEELETKQFGGRELHARRGFWRWNQAGGLGLTGDDFDHAVCLPALGRPTYQVLFGDVGPGVHLTR